MAAVAMRAMSLGRAERKPESTSQMRSETPIAALANCWWFSPNRMVLCGVMSKAANATARTPIGRMKRISAAGTGRDPPAAGAARSRIGQALGKPGHDCETIGLAHRHPGADLGRRPAAADAQGRQRVDDADVDAGS